MNFRPRGRRRGDAGDRERRAAHRPGDRTVCAVIDPELVVLGGRIGGAADLLPALRATIGRLLPLPTRIETSILAERAALEGALAMGLREARENLFSRERRAAAQ